MPLPPIIEPTAIVTPAETPDLETMKRADLPAIWDEFRTKAEKLKATAETLAVTSADDKAGMALARATRLTLKELRVAIDHKRKELGEFHLRETQRVNAAAKTLRELIEPLETRMIECEEFAVREAVRLEEEKRTARVAELTPFLATPIAVDLGKMPDAEYSALLLDTKSVHSAKLEREAKERAEVMARAKAEAEERERIRLENERLKKEAEAREAAMLKERSETAERERLAVVKAREEREAAQAKADAEAAMIRTEAAKTLAEAQAKAKKEREAIEAKAKADREGREKIEHELADRARVEKLAKQAKEEAEQRAAQAPDKQKLLAFAGLLFAQPIPRMATNKGQAALEFVQTGLKKLARDIDLRLETL